MRNADLASYRGDVYDATAPGPPEVRQHCQRGIHHPPEHDVHGISEILQGHVLHRSNADGAGVVHKDIDSPECRQHIRDELLDLSTITYVANKGPDGHLAPRKVLTGMLQLFLAARA